MLHLIACHESVRDTEVPTVVQPFGDLVSFVKAFRVTRKQGAELPPPCWSTLCDQSGTAHMTCSLIGNSVTQSSVGNQTMCSPPMAPGWGQRGAKQ